MSDRTTYHYEGFDIPVDLMLKTGGGQIPLRRSAMGMSPIFDGSSG